MKTSLPERSEHVAEQLAAITNVIRELVGDDLVMLILFGSFARGEEKRGSDVDILVEMPEGSTLFSLVGLKLDLERKIGRKVDLLTYRSIHRFIKKYIIKDAIKIYDKK